MPRTEKEVRESLWLRHLNPFQPRDYRYRQCKYFKNYTNPPSSHAHARSCPHSNFYLHHHTPTPVLVHTPTFTSSVAFLPSPIARVRCCLLLRCGCLFFWCWVVARSSFAPRAHRKGESAYYLLATSADILYMPKKTRQPPAPEGRIYITETEIREKPLLFTLARNPAYLSLVLDLRTPVTLRKTNCDKRGIDKYEVYSTCCNVYFLFLFF